MLRRLILCFAVVACGLLAIASASASAVTEKIPFDFVLTPEEGCGEAIQLSGTLLANFSLTETPSGNVEVGFHFNPQGITGVGLDERGDLPRHRCHAWDNHDHGEGRHLGHLRE